MLLIAAGTCQGFECEKVLRITGSASFIAHSIIVERLVEGALCARLAHAVELFPFCISRQVGLSNMPALLHKHRFQGVHADAIVCPMAGRVNIVIASPVAGISPICVDSIPANAECSGLWTLRHLLLFMHVPDKKAGRLHKLSKAHCTMCDQDTRRTPSCSCRICHANTHQRTPAKVATTL